MTPITPCPCCGKFPDQGCLNIDHDPYQTQEWNNIASQIRSEGQYEEFYQKQHNSEMQYFHKERRLKLQKQLEAME